MNKKIYDCIIIGAGPAGLTAAYFLAKAGLDVLVFEKEAERGYLSHPCGRMLSPIKNYVNLEIQTDGIYVKEIDLLIPNEIILAKPKLMKFIAPNGISFGMDINHSDPHFPIFQIKKGGLLKIMADKAENNGAKLFYNTEVIGLVKENNFIKGIYTTHSEVFSRVVISAEGLSRKFSEEAELYSDKKVDEIVIITRFLEGITIDVEKSGQWVYFGENIIPMVNAGLVFHSIGKDKAMIILMALNPTVDNEKQFINYLNDYINKIDWIRDYVKRGETVDYKVNTIYLKKPNSLVANGYIGAGDCVAPYGHSSNLIAMLMGKQAANTVLKAFKRNSVSFDELKSYNQLIKSKLFKGVEFEGKLIVNLLKMNNSELNKLSEYFSDVNLKPFFVGTFTEQMYLFLQLMFNPKTIINWKLLKKIF